MERVLKVYMGEEGEENLRKLDESMETVRMQKIEIEEKGKSLEEKDKSIDEKDKSLKEKDKLIEALLLKLSLEK